MGVRDLWIPCAQSELRVYKAQHLSHIIHRMQLLGSDRLFLHFIAPCQILVWVSSCCTSWLGKCFSNIMTLLGNGKIVTIIKWYNPSTRNTANNLPKKICCHNKQKKHFMVITSHVWHKHCFTDILGYSDTFGTREKCQCEEIFAFFSNMWFGKNVTVTGVTVTKYICNGTLRE